MTKRKQDDQSSGEPMARRDFLKYAGLAAGMGATALLGGISLSRNALPKAAANNMETYTSLPIRVNNPRKLGTWELSAERIVLDECYKPSIALLPGGELVLVALFTEGAGEGKIRQWTGMWRSSDGGRTWSERTEVPDLIGKEQWLTCTSDGTLLATCHLMGNDVNNPDGYIHSYMHRSTDGGATWERTRIGPEGFPARVWTTTSRNIVELPDGTLLWGVAANSMDLAYVWTSRDGGATWDKSAPPVKIGTYRDRPYENRLHGFFDEDFTFRTLSGKLLQFIRAGVGSPIYPMEDGRTVPSGFDHVERMLRCESTDNGQTWSELRDHGDYGMMYPRIIRLQDDRLLMTFTQRGVFYPIGLQAILSQDDGETWDFEADRIIIEGKTPWGMVSGGGFGNTVQLADGTLVSCYTYRAADNELSTLYDDFSIPTYLEVARWRLPER